MSFILRTPTLERLAFLKISISLWMNNFNRLNTSDDWPTSIYDYENQSQWTEIEAKICTEMDNFPILKSLKQELRTEFIFHIGQELQEWVATMGRYLPFDRKTLEFCVNQTKWTLQGKIDEQASIKSMLQRDELSVHFKFGLACFFCVDDAIRELWQQLPSNEKMLGCVCDDRINFWKIIMLGDFDIRRMSLEAKLDQYGSDLSDGGGSSAVFFFNACSEEEKVEFVKGVMKNRTVVLFCLLSRLDETQLDVLFSSTESTDIPSIAVSDWVYSEFLEVSFNRARHLFKKRDFRSLLLSVMFEDRRFDVFRRCFKFVWCNCLPEWKNYILRNSSEMHNLVEKLYEGKCLDIIYLCLRDVDVGRRKKLVKNFAKLDKKYRRKSRRLYLASLIKRMFRIM